MKSIPSFKEIIALSKLSRNIKFLYLGHLLRNISVALVGVFGTIFLYEQFNNSVTLVIVFYILNHSFFFFLVPLFTKKIQKWGTQTMMLVALPFLTLTFLFLFLWEQLSVWFVIPYLVVLLIYRLFYWMSYYIDFTLFTKTGSRGTQMALLRNIGTIALAFVPLLTGYILSLNGYGTLFIIGLIITLVAMIPLMKIENIYEEYSFGYLDTYKKLFSLKTYRNLFIGHAANGAQEMVTSVIWPIFIYIIVTDYQKIGLITSGVLILTIFLRFFIGKIADRFSDRKVLPITSALAATGWFFKALVESKTGIFLSDSYHSLGKAANSMSFYHSFYDQASDSHEMIDEFVVLSSLAKHIGKIIMLLVMIPVVIYLDIKIVFIIAGILTLLMRFAFYNKNI